MFWDLYGLDLPTGAGCGDVLPIGLDSVVVVAAAAAAFGTFGGGGDDFLLGGKGDGIF